MAEEFETDSSVRAGYHVYQWNWIPIIGKQLNCEREDENPRDRYVVAIKRSGNIVGHVPQSISAYKTAVTSLLASSIAVLAT